MEKQKEGGLPATTTAITTAPVTTTSSTTSAAPQQQQQQSYRVLEAESPGQGSGNGGGATSGATGTAGGTTGSSSAGGYHVLEAPAVIPGSAQRSTASDVLEKARNRFDKFWGKGNNGTEN